MHRPHRLISLGTGLRDCQHITFVMAPSHSFYISRICWGLMMSNILKPLPEANWSLAQRKYRKIRQIIRTPFLIVQHFKRILECVLQMAKVTEGLCYITAVHHLLCQPLAALLNTTLLCISKYAACCYV